MKLIHLDRFNVEKINFNFGIIAKWLEILPKRLFGKYGTLILTSDGMTLKVRADSMEKDYVLQYTGAQTDEGLDKAFAAASLAYVDETLGQIEETLGDVETLLAAL